MTETTNSPRDWVNEHIQRYLATNGADGHDWNGYPTLLLTTIGRRSGTPRRTALIYGRDGENYLLVASQGGLPEHPLWYRNLTANPEVQLQVGPEKFTARARTATPEEKPALWRTMVGVYPPYEEYQGRTDRDIPVVILERTS
ncbi:nitroreductase family deazaflavin-dependent oxidoreductase [Pseudonocardia acaciae]|uniref:nitroreductase family deazaflavin-dependent oxidoreductase n=1 Tax=Pseudonocardia acaciae TaxID=551276 RepID=UPI00048BEC85|nr:nitroreductase family deazaflavin-dependent oxidoreductase [Pseudonocardia acaciae]